jgi:pantothenate synthetase
LSAIQKQDAKNAKKEAEKAKQVEKELLETEFNKQKLSLSKKLESEKKQALSNGKKEASSIEGNMEEELETTKTEVLDKIQALKWAD